MRSIHDATKRITPQDRWRDAIRATINTPPMFVGGFTTGNANTLYERYQATWATTTTTWRTFRTTDLT